LESQPEHFISLPLVSKAKENPHLPLVINVIAKYWGEDLTAPESRAQAKGAVMIEGIELAENAGLVAYIYKSSLRDLKKKIDQGVPIITIMPGIQDVAQHATVVSGYSVDERRIMTYVPEPDTVGAIPESKFESDWEQDDATAIVILPADMKDMVKKEEMRFFQSNRLCFEAERLRQQGNLDRATEMLIDATGKDPENAQAWSQLGGIHNDQGVAEAVNCYERAVKINPRYYLAYRGLGNYYLKRQDYSLADAYYSKAINVNPTRYGPIYKNRAVVRMQLGNSAGAKQDLKEYLKQTPDAHDKKPIEDAIAQL
jgi:tetratricopeptide (TPR) repeat protein